MKQTFSLKNINGGRRDVFLDHEDEGNFGRFNNNWIFSFFIPFLPLKTVIKTVESSCFLYTLSQKMFLYFTMFHPGWGPSLFSNIFNHRLVCSLLYISKQKNIPLITKGRDFIPCIAWVDATVKCVSICISWGHALLI